MGITRTHLATAIAVTTLAALANVTTHADEIRLKNGRTLTGTVEYADDKNVTVRIDGVGTLTFDRSEVASIDTGSFPPADASVDGGGNPIATALSEPAAAALPASAPTAPSPTGDWATFYSRERAIKLIYPKSWHVMETDGFPYLVTIEPTPPSKDLSVAVPLTIELFKQYHLSRTAPFGQGTSEEVLTRYVDSVLPSLGRDMRVLSKRDQLVQGTASKIVELQAIDPRNNTPLHMLVLASVKQDVLITLFCQAPQEQFETYRTVCEEVFKRVEPFSKHPTQSDNAMLDAASTKLNNDAVAAMKAGDAKTAVTTFETALRMNPVNGNMRLNYGSVLFELAKSQQGQNRATLLQRSEGELQQSMRLMAIDRDPKTAPLIAHASFLLGQIAQHGRNDQVAAKAYYEQALRMWKHQGAAQALTQLETLPIQQQEGTPNGGT